MCREVCIIMVVVLELLIKIYVELIKPYVVSPKQSLACGRFGTVMIIRMLGKKENAWNH